MPSSTPRRQRHPVGRERKSRFNSSRRQASRDDKTTSVSGDASGSNSSSDFNNTPSSRSKREIPTYRPVLTIDWRAEMCRLLDLSSQISDEDLLEAIELASQNLKVLGILTSQVTEKLGPPRSRIIHSVYYQLLAIEIKVNYSLNSRGLLRMVHVSILEEAKPSITLSFFLRETKKLHSLFKRITRVVGTSRLQSLRARLSWGWRLMLRFFNKGGNSTYISRFEASAGESC
ncbi:hypothetical protein V8C34DRAFT_296006 [Trichoderma compactum]